MLPDDDQEANLEIGERYCRWAAEMGADIALMPEMWNLGYPSFESTADEVVAAFRARAIPRDGEFVGHFAALAKELEMAIAVTYLEQWDCAPRNSMSLLDRHGENVLTYAKVHTCDFAPMEAALTPGEDFPVCQLDTEVGPVAVGAMICYDREAPESARILMLNGAELILTPNACELESRRIDQFKTRAFENVVGVAMANYPAPKNNGQSVAFDSWGLLLVEAGEKEGISLASFDVEEIREHQQETIWADAYRRPHRYKALFQSEKIPIFERTNAFGSPFLPEER